MSVPTTMSGVQLTGHGGPDMLVWSDDIPVPRPAAGEVLVKVLAAGVNPTDINTRVGWYARNDDSEGGGWAGALDFPRIQGGDLCGRVVALGNGVKGLAPGARVICPVNQAEPTPENPMGFVAIGSEYDGAFAEYCCVPARHLHDVTGSPLSDTEIGAMPCAYGTAHNLLTRSGVANGDRVLITGASGGVGFAAVQLALLRGAEWVAHGQNGVVFRARHAAIRPDLTGRLQIVNLTCVSDGPESDRKPVRKGRRLVKGCPDDPRQWNLAILSVDLLKADAAALDMVEPPAKFGAGEGAAVQIGCRYRRTVRLVPAVNAGIEHSHCQLACLAHRAA